ncbi:hypothetical protein [Streptomyces sp. WMMB303]|uniref:hypothetical protein n=1 Tax=Streptomyces sp. WMMB303 TaxID=3034154 RepID=UPI0023ED046B|nr:hypothetical protein [Streptomyces sp. WMMB303]MDF4248916.1 hypothetical protein [Streptomyces sp. WMMB303]
MSDVEEETVRFTAPADTAPHPAVDAFLSAVDRSMNSNTLLLEFGAEVPVTPDNRQHLLHAFLGSDLFEELLRAADRLRGWHNLSDHGDGGDEERPLRRAGFRAAIRPLDGPGLLASLEWMLCRAPSPYRQHCSAADADRLVRSAVHELLGPDPSSWGFGSVEPDFLRSSGYFSGEEPLRPVYFDGGDADTATLLHRDRTCCLLLTNGSP